MKGRLEETENNEIMGLSALTLKAHMLGGTAGGVGRSRARNDLVRWFSVVVDKNYIHRSTSMIEGASE